MVVILWQSIMYLENFSTIVSRLTEVERVTTTVSYLCKRLTLIFVRKIQASKSSFLKTTALYM